MKPPAYKPRRSFILPTFSPRLNPTTARTTSLLYSASSWERVQQETLTLRRLYEYLNKPILQIVPRRT